ncbi:MAG: redox-sensing transcriptional repressor Rex [Mucinivorans sp.]
MKKIPEKTIERLSAYRRTLMELTSGGLTHIYSHQLAEALSITAVQVRRDLMLIGYSSDTKKGYDISMLVRHISGIIDAEVKQKVAVIGMGNLAQAITHYFNGKRTKLTIVACFDNDPQKIGQTVAGVKCYDVADFASVARKAGVTIAILTIPAQGVPGIIAPLAQSGVRGVLNFTSAPLNLHRGVFVENYDIITLLEKVAYFSK